MFNWNTLARLMIADLFLECDHDRLTVCAAIVPPTQHLFFRLTNEGQFIPCGDVVMKAIATHNLPMDWREWSGKQKLLATEDMKRTRAFNTKKVFESWAAQREKAAKEKENGEEEITS